jgi:hypothetical protein
VIVRLGAWLTVDSTLGVPCDFRYAPKAAVLAEIRPPVISGRDGHQEIRRRSGRHERVVKSFRLGSALQVELAEQSLCDRLDHLATVRILRPVRHDPDFPGVLVRHDGDGQAP